MKLTLSNLVATPRERLLRIWRQRYLVLGSDDKADQEGGTTKKLKLSNEKSNNLEDCFKENTQS